MQFLTGGSQVAVLCLGCITNFVEFYRSIVKNISYQLSYCWCHRSSYTVRKTERILVFFPITIVVREKSEKEQ